MKLGKVVKVVQVTDVENGDAIELTTSLDLVPSRESSIARPKSKELVN